MRSKYDIFGDECISRRILRTSLGIIELGLPDRGKETCKSEADWRRSAC
jgi:hypothetical protein